MNARQTWYFTWGGGHDFPNGYFVVKDATYDEAREQMVARFGIRWGFQYDETGWVKNGVSQADDYGLTEIK